MFPARVALTLLSSLTLALAAVAPAAVADSEPNNSLMEFEGPVAGGTDINGAFQTDDDEDWYAFYVSGQQQLSLTFSHVGGTGCYVEAYLRDGDGKGIGSAEFSSGSPDTITHTSPPGTNRFFVLIDDGCTGTQYRFRVEPGSGVVTGPSKPNPTPTGEPNENSMQAWGPLAGGVDYLGAIDTSNDQDWFLFHTHPGTHQLDIQVTGGNDGCYADVSVGTGGQSVDSTETSPNYVSHMQFTSSNAASYLVSVDDGCVGQRYLVRVEPASAISPSPPPAPPAPAPAPAPAPPSAAAPPTTASRPRTSPKCLSARREARLFRAKTKVTARKLRRARKRSAKRRYRAQLKRQKRALTRALDRQAINC